MMEETDGEMEISTPVAEQALRQGELYLSAQFQSALAADQRAMTVAAFFATVATAIAAGSIAYWDRTEDVPILVSGLTAAVLMAIGACLCLWTARPVDFYFPGNHPACWADILNRPINEVFWGEALNYQDSIEKNEIFLTSNSKVLYRAAVLAAAAPIIAIGIWLALATIYSSSPEAAISDGSHLQSSSGETLRSSPSHTDP